MELERLNTGFKVKVRPGMSESESEPEYEETRTTITSFPSAPTLKFTAGHHTKPQNWPLAKSFLLLRLSVDRAHRIDLSSGVVLLAGSRNFHAYYNSVFELAYSHSPMSITP
jgi:hypothetical protein